MARRGAIESELRVATLQLATDADLCKMFAITPEQLEKHRELIDKARARATAGTRFRDAKRKRVR